MKKADFVYSTFKGIPLTATFYPATKKRKNLTIVYLHGGGLIFGDRLDLPSVYLTKLLESGFDFVSLDYPLAPETKLDDILTCLHNGLNWLQQEAHTTLKLNQSNYVLFGRSAGAFLNYLLTKQLRNASSLKGLISFYGYYSLNSFGIDLPNPYYNKYPKVPPMAVNTLLQSLPLIRGNPQERLAIYLSGRQYGNWCNYFLPSPRDKNRFSLTEQDLSLFPPTFLTHSTQDPDVSHRFSQTAAKQIPLSSYYEVSLSSHDFDADLANPIGKQVYQNLVAWLTTLTN